MIGEVLLSRYKITQALGGGGFSDTYLARDLALPGEPYCVVKHLRPKERKPGILKVAQELFEREATVLYKLGQHDLIPSLYAHFKQGHEFFLVQEYIKGHDIAEELVAGHPLPECDVLKLLTAILTPLTILHQDHFIHRDLKPHNLRRRADDGKVLLIDFGAVKEIRNLTLLSSGETSRTITVGSPGYMPSEQLAGRPKLSSDIYAVGMIGVQALTGQSPGEFEEDPFTGELRWQPQAQVSSELRGVLQKMIHPYHLNRYPNAQDALAAVQAITARDDRNVSLTTVQPSSDVTQVMPSLTHKAFSARLPWHLLLPIGGSIIALTLGVLIHPMLPQLIGDGQNGSLTPVDPVEENVVVPAEEIANAPEPRPSPVDALETYYQGINERKLGKTWKQLTPEKQERGGGFRSYLEWWYTVNSVHIIEIELVSESTDQAQVKVELWYSLKNGKASQELKSLVTLRWDDKTESWLLDRAE